MGEQMYISTLSCPKHYIELCDQLHAPAAIATGKEAPASLG
jgi:hypothetical protein